ncbi:TRAP transporter substrate-binding protein [Paracoccus siganidrum]|uniref:TRAP transporter substrate-binding protein n=1 Tax=Paracoccus siganidrum TaxID=1276757 RepID=A0A419A8K1_9RHOB|nr:TRAP transporter substrate-binding protein [Paracoccus siganidrum]RJL18506.1 TRAP transporter substrate-binding protein [Paracoccus siganidrum]RMC39806.1 C4-dicarboxylate ABC transporter substrate-binding protein [Paracoccus siganidrum]
MSFLTRILGGTALALSLGALALPAAATEYRIAVGDGAGGTQEALGKAFVAALEEKSGGAITGRLFLNGQLGDEQDTVTAAATGTLDFSILAINNITPFSPSVGTLTLPYVILSQEDAETLTQGEIGQQMIDQTVEDAGVRIIGWGYSGFRVLTNSKRPVATVADLQGLVVRVPRNEIMIESYKSWGINPTPMAWGETFAALQQGVVDGQDNPYMTIYAMKFDEVQKHITDLRYIFSIEPLIVSESLFQSLSPDEQQQVLEAGQEATQASAAFLREEEDKIRAELVERGMEITQPADDEQEFIELATANVWPKFYDQIGGKEVLNGALAALGRDPVE